MVDKLKGDFLHLKVQLVHENKAQRRLNPQFDPNRSLTTPSSLFVTKSWKVLKLNLIEMFPVWTDAIKYEEEAEHQTREGFFLPPEVVFVWLLLTHHTAH